MDKKFALCIFFFCAALALCCIAPHPVWAREDPAPSVQSGQEDSQGMRAKPSDEKKRTTGKAKRLDARAKEKSLKGIHAPAWVFGGKAQSRDAWRGGTSTDELQKRATGDDAPQQKAVNTTASINSALKGPMAKEEHKSGMAVSVGQEDSSWRPKGQHEFEADENIPMQSRHVVRAYADVDAGDDLSIRIGPELILKDEQRERAAVNKQPESALGLGMQFKLDF